jgi:hypothetical protein
MTRDPRGRARKLVFSLVVLQLQLCAGFAFADDHPARRARRTVAVNRVQPCEAPRRTSTLGTFYPTPYITVRGNAPVGGGYSPNETYGDSTLALYGPLSAFRTSTAPVLTYVRGYDGQTRLTEAVSFSNPNLPVLSPVRYPTEGNYYYGPRVIRVMPWGANAINWIDQN